MPLASIRVLLATALMEAEVPEVREARLLRASEVQVVRLLISAVEDADRDVRDNARSTKRASCEVCS